MYLNSHIVQNLSMHLCTRKQILLTFICAIFQITHVSGIGQVIWAVNCGGDAHTDIHGIKYQKDMAKSGIPSDYGKSLLIQRVVPQDAVLYQTERYNLGSFSYDIPLSGDGEYVLVLKFCEVWFAASSQKIFDVKLNEHSVLQGLDIFATVGRGIAHDEHIPFVIKNGKMKWKGQSSSVGSKINIEFVKGEADNPKCNAIYLMKGSIDDVPKLPAIPQPEEKRQEETPEEEDEEEEKTKKPRRISEPKVQDPYASEDASTMMLPILVAIGCFIPLVFCLCKL